VGSVVKRILYLVPGAGQSARGLSYRPLRRLFAKEGFLVVPVSIKWKQFDLGWLPEYAQAVERAVIQEPHEAYLLGFSWGAVSALVAAKRMKPKALILCSLSPYFAEDRFFCQQFLMEKSLERFQTIKLEERMMALPFTKAVRITVPKTFVLYGEKEPGVLINRCVSTANAIPQAKLISLPRTPHNILAPAYLRAIKKIAQTL
jgi:pimeloyl-ACP methyl ester carboxylesterase